MKKALFYEGEWNVFNNFSAFMVFWRGVLWATVEHAYQSAKFTDEKIILEIKTALSPHDAKRIARRHKDSVRPDWLSINLGVMEEILRTKVAQHPYVKKKLIESKGLELVEDSPRDSFWGRGPDWKGLNWLGKIWMKIRDEL